MDFIDALVLCTHCDRHIRVNEYNCPFCGKSQTSAHEHKQPTLAMAAILAASVLSSACTTPPINHPTHGDPTTKLAVVDKKDLEPNSDEMTEESKQVRGPLRYSETRVPYEPVARPLYGASPIEESPRRIVEIQTYEPPNTQQEINIRLGVYAQADRLDQCVTELPPVPPGNRGQVIVRTVIEMGTAITVNRAARVTRVALASNVPQRFSRCIQNALRTMTIPSGVERPQTIRFRLRFVFPTG